MIIELRINGELLLARKIDGREFDAAELLKLDTEIAARIKKAWIAQDLVTTP